MQQIDAKTQGNEQIGDGPEIVGVYVVNIAEHSSDVSDGVFHIVCPEEDPGEGYQEKRHQDLKYLFKRRVPFSGGEIISKISPVLSLQE